MRTITLIVASRAPATITVSHGYTLQQLIDDQKLTDYDITVDSIAIPKVSYSRTLLDGVRTVWATKGMKAAA